MISRAEKPLSLEKVSRLSTWLPMATAGRGSGYVVVLAIPKGMFASEKWLPLGMGIQLDMTARGLIVKVVLRA